MFILTKHAKEKIKKRLIKKKNVDLYDIWKSALEFAKKAVRLEDEKFIYFTNGKYTLIVVKRYPRILNKEEAIKFLHGIQRESFVVYKNGNLYRLSKQELLKILEDNIVISEYGDVYFGKPYIAITLRPAKNRERAVYYHNNQK